MAQLKSLNYDDCMKRLQVGQSQTVGNNTTVLRTVNDCIEVRLHGYLIVNIFWNQMIFDSHGYRTKTTKDRMNTVLDDNGYTLKIYQDKGEWYFWDYTVQREFKYTDGMIIN